MDIHDSNGTVLRQFTASIDSEMDLQCSTQDPQISSEEQPLHVERKEQLHSLDRTKQRNSTSEQVSDEKEGPDLEMPQHPKNVHDKSGVQVLRRMSPTLTQGLSLLVTHLRPSTQLVGQQHILPQQQAQLLVRSQALVHTPQHQPLPHSHRETQSLQETHVKKHGKAHEEKQRHKDEQHLTQEQDQDPPQQKLQGLEHVQNEQQQTQLFEDLQSQSKLGQHRQHLLPQPTHDSRHFLVSQGCDQDVQPHQVLQSRQAQGQGQSPHSHPPAMENSQKSLNDPQEGHKSIHGLVQIQSSPNEAVCEAGAPDLSANANLLSPGQLENPVLSASSRTNIPHAIVLDTPSTSVKKPVRMPGTKQCPSCHSMIAAAVAKCPKCPHVFREKKEKVKRSGKRGKKNCPKCRFENPSACSSCKKCQHVFRLKLMDKYKAMRPRHTSEAALAAAAAAAHAAANVANEQHTALTAVSAVPLPAGVAAYPNQISRPICQSTIAVIPSLAQHSMTNHPRTHDVQNTAVSQSLSLAEQPILHQRPNSQL